MIVYATVEDLEILFRTLKKSEKEKAEQLLITVSARLRYEAKKAGKNLDEMMEKDEDLTEVAKSVTCDVVARTLMTATDREPMSQYSESALGYSVSGTFLVPGGGIFIKDSELKALGLKRQRYGGLELYEHDQRHNRGSL